RVEHAAGVLAMRAVVESQHDLVVLEPQRLLILLRPDPWKLGRAHRNRAAGAEGIFAAGVRGESSGGTESNSAADQECKTTKLQHPFIPTQRLLGIECRLHSTFVRRANGKMLILTLSALVKARDQAGSRD